MDEQLRKWRHKNRRERAEFEIVLFRRLLWVAKSSREAYKALRAAAAPIQRLPPNTLLRCLVRRTLIRHG